MDVKLKVKPNEQDRRVAFNVWSEIYRELVPPTEFEASIMDEAHDLAEFCVAADDRTFCILVGSFLEDTLKRTFSEYWRIETKKEFGRYFGGNGPLSTFSQRVLVAKGLTWLTSEESSELDMLRKVRNAFAHDHRIHSLMDEKVRGPAESLHKWEQIWCYRREYAEPYNLAPVAMQLRMRVFCAGIFIISSCLAQAKLLQAKLPKGFRPSKSWDAMLELEQGMIDAAIRYCWRCLGFGYTGDAIYEYQSKGPRPWERLKQDQETEEGG